jgi:glycine cleavage system H protein
MNPKENKYTDDHEWIRLDGDAKWRVGLADYAQSQLGDLVFIELCEPGTQVTQFTKMGEIESVKAVSDFNAPISGAVTAINQDLIDNPQRANEDPYGAGWFAVIEPSNPDELVNLMDSQAYDAFAASLCCEDSE